MKLFLALTLSLALGCAPTYRVVTKRCPTVTMLLSDFVVGSMALAVSAVKYNNGHKVESLAYTAVGGAMFIGANLAETTCRR